MTTPEPDPPTPEESEVDDAAYLAVADAYYRKAIDAPEAARRRAQGAYAIAGAVAAAVVTAGAFGDLAGRPLSVRLLGAMALIAWIATAALFMRAVAAPFKSLRKELFSKLDFVNEVMGKAESEREAVDDRQLLARSAAALASFLTVAVVALALFLPAASDAKAGMVDLSPGEQKSLSALCGEPVPEVMTGEIDEGSSGDDTLSFDPAAKLCDAEGDVTLQKKKTVWIVN